MQARIDSGRGRGWLARVCALAAGLVGLAGIGRAQWEVDQTTATLATEGEVYADHECNNPPALVDPIPRPTPLQLQGTCAPGARLPLHGNAVIDKGMETGLSFPAVFFDFGKGLDIMAFDEAGVPCHDPFTGMLVTWAISNGHSFFVGDGLDTRTLSLHWNTDINNEAIDGEFYDRGCIDLAAFIEASFRMPRTTNPFFLRFELQAEGDADSTHECPAEVPLCTRWGLPPSEDPEQCELTVTLDVDGAGPGTLLDVLLDPLNGFPSVWGPTVDMGSFTFPPGPRDIDVTFDVFSRASATTQAPWSEVSSANIGGRLFLHIVSHDFLTDGEDFDSYMRVIPQGGPGPRYPYRMGRHEITNQQYADFLNAAEYDGGATEIGAYLVFDADGAVSLADGTVLFQPQGVVASSRIAYTAAAPLGTRYTVETASGATARSYERHPVTNVSWIGALKFCNWLTLNRGYAPAERCYSEGPALLDWHPVTISTAAWALRDLTDGERARLVAQYRGFRLPMDGLGTRTGFVGSQAGYFNEWYKAAAYDPAAPGFARLGPGGELVPPFHWAYGVGRDTFGAPDGNFFASTDPYDDDDAFVGLYDGSSYNPPGGERVGSGAFFASAASANRYGLYDMSGNVLEHGQDRVLGQDHALHSGSWRDAAALAAATYRDSLAPTASLSTVGFRIVQALPTKVLIGQTPVTLP